MNQKLKAHHIDTNCLYISIHFPSIANKTQLKHKWNYLCTLLDGDESKITHSLYSQKYKENIPGNKKPEFYFAPRNILK